MLKQITILNYIQKKQVLKEEDLQQYLHKQKINYNDMELQTALALLEHKKCIQFEHNDTIRFIKTNPDILFLKCKCNHEIKYRPRESQKRKRIYCSKCKKTREFSRYKLLTIATQIKKKIRQTNTQLEDEILQKINKKPQYCYQLATDLNLKYYQTHRIIEQLIIKGKIEKDKLINKRQYYRIPLNTEQPKLPGRKKRGIGRQHNLMWKTRFFKEPIFFKYDKICHANNWDKKIIDHKNFTISVNTREIVYQSKRAFFINKFKEAKENERLCVNAIFEIIAELEPLGFKIEHIIRKCGKDHIAYKNPIPSHNSHNITLSNGTTTIDESDGIEEIEDSYEVWENVFLSAKKVPILEQQNLNLANQIQILTQKIEYLERLR